MISGGVRLTVWVRRHLILNYVSVSGVRGQAHLDGLGPEESAGEVVFVDFIGCGVHIHSSHHFCGHPTLWRKDMEMICRTCVLIAVRLVIMLSC